MSQQYLELRGPVFWFRRKIPLDILPLYGGKTEIRHSLRTSDRSEAVRRARVRSVELDEEFAQVRGKTIRSSHSLPAFDELSLSEPVIYAICQRWKRAILLSDDENRMSGFKYKSYEDINENLADIETPLRSALAKGELDYSDKVLRSFLFLSRISINESGSAYQRLQYEFLQTLIETLELQKRRQAGHVIRTDAVAPLAEAYQRQAQSVTKGAGMTMDELFAYWRDAVDGRPAATVSAFETATRQFKEFTANKPASEVDKALVRAFLQKLKVEGKGGKTRETKLSILSAMFQLAVEDDLLALNPASGIKIAKAKVNAVVRLPYDSADLKAILSSPVYSNAIVPDAGGGDAAKWIPLLGFFTGARLEELCQLLVTDIVEDAEFGWYLNITDATDDEIDTRKSIKTADSRRRVPVHPQLIEAGFIRFVARMRDAGEVRLFPQLKADAKGKLSGNWSKWWGRYARKVLGIKSRLKVFHSTRHAFKDACRDAGIEEAIHDALTGHSGGGVGRQYGSKKYPLRPLVEAIGKINYPGIVLPIVEM